jgi:hypothetical protein
MRPRSVQSSTWPAIMRRGPRKAGAFWPRTCARRRR